MPPITTEFPVNEATSGLSQQRPVTHRETGDPAQRLAWKLAWILPTVVLSCWIIAGHIMLIPDLSQWPPGAGGACGIVAAMMLVTATVTDLRSLKIRNWTTFPAFAFVTGLNLLQSIAHHLPEADINRYVCGMGFSQAVLGGVLCFSGMFALHLLFGGGAGDIKLMTVIGLLVGWQSGFQIWLLAILSGATFALGHTATRIGWRGCLFLLSFVGHPWAVSRYGSDWIREHLRFRMPMAPHFTIGYVLVMLIQAGGYRFRFIDVIPL